MQLPFLSAGRSRRRRRGVSLVEVALVAALTGVLMMAVAGLLRFAGLLNLQVNLQRDSTHEAVKAMSQMTVEVREAVRVSIIQPYQFRIYYPTKDGRGLYDLTKPDYSSYVEYLRTDSAGNPSATGVCLWRRTNASSGSVVVQSNLQNFTVTFFPYYSDNSVRITIDVLDQSSGRSSRTRLSQRVLFLRNYYGSN
jgi:hypothetical protein